MSQHLGLNMVAYFSRHSEERYDDDETEYETKQRILSASLPFVHSQGWTHSAIAKGKLDFGDGRVW